MLINIKDDMDLRLKDEFDYLSKKYSNVAFNCIDWGGNQRVGKDYLFAVEGYITVPQNYDIDVIKKYKALLTPSSKFYELNKDKCNIILTNGPLDSHNYHKLDTIKTYDERITGICALYRMYSTGRDGDILWMRNWLMTNLPSNGVLEKHCYGSVPWGGTGGSIYKGYSKTANHGNHIDNLNIMQNYKFCLAIEPMHHEIWSSDWVTERLWNAFKAKTVPVYFGCFNIENKVPKDLYIDYRSFSSLNDLSKFMLGFDKNKWIDMTEKAYDWYYNECKISNLQDLEEQLKGL